MVLSESKVWRNWAYAIALLATCTLVIFFFGHDLHAAPLSVKCAQGALTVAIGMKFTLQMYEYERSGKTGLGYVTLFAVLAAAAISLFMYL